MEDLSEGQRYRNDVEFAKFLPHIPQPFTREDAEQWIEANMRGPWGQYPVFAIEHDGRLIGDVNLTVDTENRSAMIGYSISREHWGKGITAEAAQAVIGWAFEAFNLTRIWASTDARHAQSCRVLEKLGMRRESLLSNHHIGRDGEQVDEVVYGFTRENWDRNPRHHYKNAHITNIY